MFKFEFVGYNLPIEKIKKVDLYVDLIPKKWIIIIKNT